MIFSAGGGLRACDDELLPCPEDRNGRHWVRVELSIISRLDQNWIEILNAYLIRIVWCPWPRRVA